MLNTLPVVVLYVETNGTTRVVVNGEEIADFPCKGDARLCVDVLFPEVFELRIEEGVR